METFNPAGSPLRNPDGAPDQPRATAEPERVSLAPLDPKTALKGLWGCGEKPDPQSTKETGP